MCTRSQLRFITGRAYRTVCTLGAVVLAALAVLAAPAAADTSPILAPSSGALFGAWHKGSSSWSQSDFAGFESLVGRKLAIDHRYVDWGATWWPGDNESWDLQNGRYPMLSIGGDSTFPGLDAINNGSQDAYIAGRADAIKALGGKVFLRPWWEMNANWYPWGGPSNNTPETTDGPTKYVLAWRRLHDIFIARGATNAIWVWSPNCDSSPADAWNNFINYYPGDGYVDWVACDGFNWGTTQSWSSWQQWSYVFGNSWNGQTRSHGQKPKPDHIDAGATFASRHPPLQLGRLVGDLQSPFPVRRSCSGPQSGSHSDHIDAGRPKNLGADRLPAHIRTHRPPGQRTLRRSDPHQPRQT